MTAETKMLLEKLELWRQDPEIGNKKMYARGVGRLLPHLPGLVAEWTPDILKESAKKMSKSYEFQEKVVIALRHFVDYCHAKGWITEKPELRRSGLGTYRELDLPASLVEEFDEVFRSIYPGRRAPGHRSINVQILPKGFILRFYPQAKIDV